MHPFIAPFPSETSPARHLQSESLKSLKLGELLQAIQGLVPKDHGRSKPRTCSYALLHKADSKVIYEYTGEHNVQEVARRRSPNQPTLYLSTFLLRCHVSWNLGNSKLSALVSAAPLNGARSLWASASVAYRPASLQLWAEPAALNLPGGGFWCLVAQRW